MVHFNTSVYITRNEVELKIRKKYASNDGGYTVDVFPNYIKIHQQASPSITVL